MTVSAKGVSHGSTPASENPWAILAVASDPEGTKQRLAELTEATLRHEKAVAAHGTVSQIEALLSDAKAQQARKTALLSKARGTAKEIIDKAEARADEIIAQSKADMQEKNAAFKDRVEHLREREVKVEALKAEIGPLHEKASKALAEAEQAKSLGERLRSTYEFRVRKLKEAMKEARE